MLFMKTTVALGKLRGKKTFFTFGKGNYLEENVLGDFEYALGGFLSKREVISFGKGNGFPLKYGTLKLVEPGCTKDRIVSSYADVAPEPPTPACCTYQRRRAACPEGALPLRGQL